jgi:adenine phosphoribosyltransferase
MEDNVKLLRKSVVDAPVVMKGDYAYFVHPLTDGVPRQSSNLLAAARDLISQKVDWDDVDLILGIEAMGLPLASALSISSGKPLVIARKRAYGLAGETVIDQNTGYSKGEIYLNDIQKNERVLVVDDVVSTGGTIEPILQTLESMGAHVEGVHIIFEKGEGMDFLRQKYGWNLSSLVKLKMDGEKVILLD